MSIILLAAAAVMAAATCAFALDIAGVQPTAPYGVFSTLMTNSPAQGHSAVTFGLETTVKPGFTRFTTGLATGITDRMEAGLTIPYISRQGGGLEDITISFKHRILEEGDYSPSIAYLLAASLDTGVEGSTSGGAAVVGMLLTKRAGPFRGNMNLLYEKPFDRKLYDNARFSAGLEFSATNSSILLAEFVMDKGYTSRTFEQEGARFGYRFIYDEGIFTTVGMGMDVGSRVPNYRVMASLSVLFPRVEHIIEKVYEEGN